MKYFTLDYNANAPTPKCIKVPVNSEYGVAVKVYKDEQLVSADLSVDGVACVEGFDGWQLAELSSGNVETMKSLDVEALKEPTVCKEINPVGEAVNTSTRVKTVAIVVPLSAFFDSDITIKPEDVSVLSFKTRDAADTAEYQDDWTDTNTSFTTTGKWMTFQDNNLNFVTCIQNDGVGHVNCWLFRDGTYEYGEKTIPTSFKIWLYSGPLPGHTKTEYSAIIQIDTKNGFSGKFKLLVQEQDLGYFEK